MTEKTYEMLWDCEYCDHKKLLGKTHRHCPECGAAQNPERRYFPAEEEKVAVEDHEYFGADRICLACQAANSAKAQYCCDCGSPMDGAADAKGVDEKPPAAVAPKKTAPKSKKKVIIIAAVVAVVLAIVGVVLFANKEQALSVTGHRWSREIEIEKFKEVSESAWCNQMPRGAFNISRKSEVRSHKKIPDGQDCRTVRKDNKDGTFSEREECTTKYREEPVYDDKCYYRIHKWVVHRAVKNDGDRLSDNIDWPTFQLVASVTKLGSEREGRHIESYTVLFKDADGENYSCDFGQAKWAGFKKDSNWVGDVNMVTTILDCDTVKAPKK